MIDYDATDERAGIAKVLDSNEYREILNAAAVAIDRWQHITVDRPAWHCHHEQLVEEVYSGVERISYILSDKPHNQLRTRLTLFRPLSDSAVIEYHAIETTYQERSDTIKDMPHGGYATDDETAAYYKALKDLDKDYQEQLSTLHKADCVNSIYYGHDICTWDDEQGTIFPDN